MKHLIIRNIGPLNEVDIALRMSEGLVPDI